VISRIRKAVIAGVGAGITAGLGALAVAGALTREELTKALGVAVAGGAAVAWTTWRTPNVEEPYSAPVERTDPW
jgi:hypothetical protein